jgi:hypothetical protein
VRTTLWRYHLGGGCVLALAYVYLPIPTLRVGALVVLCVATVAATLAATRLCRPARRLPFLAVRGLGGGRVRRREVGAGLHTPRPRAGVACSTQ